MCTNTNTNSSIFDISIREQTSAVQYKKYIYIYRKVTKNLEIDIKTCVEAHRLPLSYQAKKQTNISHFNLYNFISILCVSLVDFENCCTKI